MNKKYTRLTFSERVTIEALLTEKKSKAYIAEFLGRARSTISREVNPYTIGPKDKYNAELAHWLAEDDYLNKRNLDKINTFPKLKLFVYKSLLNKLSPEQISGRLKIIFPNDPIMSISFEAIYQHIYRHRQSKLGRKLIALLPYHRSKRRTKRKEAKNRIRIKDQVSIDNRPKHIENRKQVGHWEGDLMIGLGQKSAIGTLVERKTRYTLITKVDNRKSETVTKAFAKTIKKLPENVRKSMTYDNGMEMANHKWFSKNTRLDVYFAHPYSSWERGTNENTNGLIRRFFPKKTDFNKVTAQQLMEVQDMLNNRPRKVLGYLTPNEMMKIETIDRRNISEITFGSFKNQKSYPEIKLNL